MNKTLGKGLALVLGMGIMAGCEYQENTAKPKPQAPELVEIAANECKDLCGGKICYEDIRTRVESGELTGYTIASEGFNNYTNLGGKMIVAGECVLYKLSNDMDSLVLEKLR